jgi:hypothetical protein
MSDPYKHGYNIKVEPTKKGDGDFIAGVVCAILMLALLGWLFG